MPNQLRLTLILGVLIGAIWPLFNVLSIYSPPSVIQVVMVGEALAVLYMFSDLPPYRRWPRVLSRGGLLLLPVLMAMLFR